MVSTNFLAWLVILSTIYLAVLIWAIKKGSDRFQAVGPLLMVRTQTGKKALDKLSRSRIWAPVGDVFIVLTILAGAVMLLLVVYQNVLLFTHTDIVRERPPRVQETLAIPGLNPVIPVTYGIFALVVALVIHEGGHGVLARFAKLPVKSLGLLFLILPVGAFVEPDEAAMQRTSLRAKLRLFAAGPGPNLVLAAVTVVLFSQLMMPAVAAAHDGVALVSVTEGLPADEGGLRPGMFVTAIDQVAVRTQEEFQDVMDTKRPGQVMNVDYWHHGREGTATVVPVDRYTYFQENFPERNNETFRGKAFLGVGPAGPDQLMAIFDALQHPFRELGLTGALFYIALPFLGFQPFPTTYDDLYTTTDLFAGWGDGFWILANTLYWLFWLNVVLGTFNALPLGPLDGGHMFRHTMHAFLRRRKHIPDEHLDVVEEEGKPPKLVGRSPEVQVQLDVVDARVRTINRAIGYSLLVLILVPLIVPQFL